MFRFTETCDTDKWRAPKWLQILYSGKKDTQAMLKKEQELEAVFL